MAARSVLVTGANRGLGLEMVRQLAEPGPGPGPSPPVRHVVACCRDPSGPRSQALQELAGRHPGVITIVQLDATDFSSIQRCSQQVGVLLGAGGLNLLINNAAILSRGNMQTTEPEDLLASFNTNVLGPMNITKEFLSLLRAAAAAHGAAGMSCSKAAVVNITSMLGSIDMVAQSYGTHPTFSYRLSKAALNMMTVCGAQEFRQDDILFAALHPGWVKTDMGGKGAQIEASVSVSGLLRVMESLTEKQNGAFLDYTGATLPW
ncbi:hypothetical protein CRUP_000749 [Coryphaenoides rupestris]|nr:hypothetical protein CRUP_000749 [Coryphaenoides rupestris]